jgi:hypothetical protein
MMGDRLMAVLAGLLRRAARLLPADRQGWAEALLAETGEVPARAGRLAWLLGGLWLVGREAVLGPAIRALAFAAGATALARISWPGPATDSAVPLNRVYLVGTVLILAVLPTVIRRYVGPVRRGWAPRTLRIAGYAAVLAMVAAKAVKGRIGSQLGAYFVVVPGIWAMEILLLLVIGAYVAALLILTTRRVQLTRWGLPAAMALGVITAAALYPLAPFGVSVDPDSPSLPWWWLAALLLPVAAGALVARLAAREKRPGSLHPVAQGALGAACAMATAAMLIALVTSVAIALFPHRIPLQNPGPPANGGCETCDPNQTIIPVRFRHQYYVDLSIGQSGDAPFAALFIMPILGAGLGAFAAGVATQPRRRDPAPSCPPGLEASDA